MSATTVPEVLWAQRSSSDEPSKNIIYLSINAYDCAEEEVKLDIQPTKLTFTGASKTKTFHVALEFYAEIDTAESKRHISARGVDLVLRKKELNAEFWPRLLKDSQRQHFLKTDFDKWVDEDEQDEGEAASDSLGGMGGMGGEDGGFGGLDFSKLGGMGGMGGGMGGMGGMGGGMDMESMMGGMGGMGGAGGDDDDDEDMPELEGDNSEATEEPKTEAPKDEGAKIEEISDPKEA